MASTTIVHDYLTQRGGAERVVLGMIDAFPDAPVFTSLFEPSATFPELGQSQVITSPLNRVGLLRRHHRLAMPLLPLTFSRMEVPGDVVLCSSSGWAHGVRTEGRKVVYCHSPAKWLYQQPRYFRGSLRIGGVVVVLFGRPLRDWDRRAARSADRYLVNSIAVQGWVREAYGIEAEILPPAYTTDPEASQMPLPLDDGFVLCVSRLMPYKNVDAVVAAMEKLPDERLVVAGTGPEAGALRMAAGRNVTFLGAVDDEQLRWLYAHSVGVVCASYEDFGLVPIEAAAFGRPVAALEWGGFLETVIEGVTGIFFPSPEPASIAESLRTLIAGPWHDDLIRRHAALYAPGSFARRLRSIVAEVATG